MVEDDPDNLSPADEGETVGFIHKPRAGGGWTTEPAPPKQRFGANEIPIAVIQEEVSESLGFDVNHPEISNITAVCTNDSGLGHAVRKTMAATSRGEIPIEPEQP